MELDFDFTKDDLDAIRSLMANIPYCNNNMVSLMKKIENRKRYIYTCNGHSYLAFKLCPQYHIMLNTFDKSWSITATGKH
jgi:hypothetical protein